MMNCKVYNQKGLKLKNQKMTVLENNKNIKINYNTYPNN